MLELHGSVQRNYCTKCGKFYDVNYIAASKDIPRCNENDCNGVIKPDVVLYEEGLDEKILSKSIKYIQNAQMLIIGGTSLAVYPAAGLIDYFDGKYLVVINKMPTPKDNKADLVLDMPIGQVFRIVT